MVEDVSAQLGVAVRARFRKVLDTLGVSNSPVALLGFPDYPNVGDSAIWVGQRQMLDEVGVSLRYIATETTYDPEGLRRAVAGGPVLLSGGGNFGDVWPHHHASRLRVLATARGQPVVQLPQSIHFARRDTLEATQRAIAAHGNVTLLLRDRHSYEFAVQHFDCPCYLTPDSAFALGKMSRAAGNWPVLWLMREDRESRISASMAFPNEVVSRDWLTETLPRRLRLQRAMIRRASMYGRHTGLYRAYLLRYADALAAERVRRGTSLLAGSSVVVSDRLHAHILCMLLERPSVVLDNSYGKVQRFVYTWQTNRSPLVRVAQSVDHAVTLVKEFRQLSSQHGGRV